jgi:hypothetical protein
MAVREKFATFKIQDRLLTCVEHDIFKFKFPQDLCDLVFSDLPLFEDYLL